MCNVAGWDIRATLVEGRSRREHGNQATCLLWRAFTVGDENKGKRDQPVWATGGELRISESFSCIFNSNPSIPCFWMMSA